MSGNDRREFLRTAAAISAGAAFGAWSFKARADLNPARSVIFHITDTRFGIEDDPEGKAKAFSGMLFNHAYTIADDLVDRFVEEGGGKGHIIHGGNLIRSGTEPEAVAARQWIKGLPLDLHLTMGDTDVKTGGLDRAGFIDTFRDYGFSDGRSYYSHDRDGFHFVHLDTADLFSWGKRKPQQLDWLRQDLESNPRTPTVVVMQTPLIQRSTLDIFQPREIISEFPQIALILAGGDRNSGGTYISTCSPVAYPCGARMVEIEVASGGLVTVRSKFLQTRLLTLVEESFHRTRPRGHLMFCLGGRKDRDFTVSPDRKGCEPVRYPVNPALAPIWKGAHEINLAVMSDTHLCLDRYVSEKARGDNDLIGHFMEPESKAIYDDCIGRIEEGVHRVEFYDQVFARDPAAEVNYLELPIDGLLITGDLTEHGREGEARLVRDRLDKMPARLRANTMVTFGNHDRYAGDFSPRGEASGPGLIADFYSDYLPEKGDTSCVVRLNEWLTMIVLDSVIPSETPLGLIQERIDCLIDQIEGSKDQVIIIACHHPLYKLTTVPPLMYGYLRARSHFTPKHSATRTQIQGLFARNNHVKLAITGHYHGVVTDQFSKAAPAGSQPDDLFTTHIQVPCTIEYPCGYRIFRIRREGDKGTIEYTTAYTRLHKLREQSSRATLFRLFGRKARPSRKYRESLDRLAKEENFSGDLARIDPNDLFDVNVRGYKDGSAGFGRGNTGKPNIRGRIEFSL